MVLTPKTPERTSTRSLVKSDRLLGYLVSVWWAWTARTKIIFAVGAPIIGAILSLLIFWIGIVLSDAYALLAFWSAFAISNAAVLCVGKALPKYVAKE